MPKSDEAASPEDDERWIPPGFDMAWRLKWVSENKDDPGFEVSVTVPPSDAPVNFSEAKVSRIGGVTLADRQFRTSLYYWIGQATVLSGKIEAGMKRLLLIMGDGPSAEFSSVDHVWTTLSKRLVIAAKNDTVRGPTLLKVLERAEEERVKERRDNVVHGYWWDFEGIGVRVARYKRDGSSYILNVSIDYLQESCLKMGQLASDLDHLAGPDWLSVYLPSDVSG